MPIKFNEELKTHTEREKNQKEGQATKGKETSNPELKKMRKMRAQNVLTLEKKRC